MRLNLCILLLLGFFLFGSTAFAQTFSGMLDGYWSYNSNTPRVGSQANGFRAFDTRDQSFSLNYGEIVVDYKPKDVGLRLDIGFGDAADIIHSREPGGQDLWRHIEQAYITGTHDGFTIDFGKFVTPIGAEVIETTDNWNYSRGLLFTLGIPRYHFGARGRYAANGRVALLGYVVNGWNNVRDTNTAKSVGFGGTFTPADSVSVTANVLLGKESFFTDSTRQLYDGVVNFTAIPNRLWFMANYDYVMDHGPFEERVFWQGAAGYAKFKAYNALTVSSRYEWFGDHNGVPTGALIPQNLQSYTATAQIPWSQLTLWGEFRRDWSNLTTFNKTKAGTQSLVDHQNTFTLGVTYAFVKAVN